MKITRKQFIKRVKVLSIVIMFSLILIYADIRGAFEIPDNRTFDFFHKIKGQKKEAEHVALVEIDNKTFKELKNEPMAFWGPNYAKAIRVLKEAGVRTIGIDTFFSISIESWFDKFGGDWGEKSRLYDVDFRKELAKGGVALVCSFSSKDKKAEMQLPVLEYIYSMPGGLNDIGIANLIYDNDGIIRRFTQSYFENEKPPYLSFAALLAKKHAGDKEVITKKTAFKRIFYHGPPSTFPSISFSELLKENAADNEIIKGFKDKVVIIAFGIDTKQDMQQTPFSRVAFNSAGSMMSGGEVHANIVETILSESYAREFSLFEKFIYFFIFSFASAYIFIKLGIVAGALNIFILILINGILSYVFFSYNIYTPVDGTSLLIGLNYLLSLSLRFSSEEKEKKYLMNMFERCVSPEVVKKMVETGSSPALGGEMHEVTVLFSDIRNFTTISEILEPYELVEMLNRYFTIVCDKILDTGGFIDKFIGDAIMVIFGAPYYFDDHAEVALRTALIMDEEAKKFSKWVKDRFGSKYDKLPEFKIGVGLHCGEAIIGNIGYIKRFNFTAIGDVVNVASRLEGLTKEFNANIIVSRDLLDKVKSDFITGEKQMIKVKGKNKEIEIIEFLGFNRDDSLTG